MAVTSTRILDCLAEACTRFRADGTRGIDWTWFRSMTPDERLAFDTFLVKMGDPLAWQAGSPESRFRTRVTRMVNAS